MNTLSPLGEQTKQTISELQRVLTNINQVLNNNNKANLEVILKNLSETTENLNKSMVSIESMLQKQNGSIANTASNLSSFTKNLNENNKKINNILSNLDTTTKQIKDADLTNTIKTIQVAVNELSITLNQLNKGNGSASKLLNDSTVYTQLKNTIQSVNTLVDDVKVHPKRYINISVFGKKDKSIPLSKPIADTLN